jgi:beta-mannosidase
VWHGQEDFQVFAEKLPRFSSEYGFQAFPPMETVEAFTLPEERGLFHPTMLAHQKHPIGNQLILEYMGRDYPVPEAFDDLVYVSQLLQATGMRIAFEAHRRAMPRTMGTLYWQLNDTWPVVSWSSRDYFGRFKALHYAARKAFAPTLLSTVLQNDTVEVWGIRDPGDPVDGILELELLDLDGSLRWADSVPVGLGDNQSRVLWKGHISGFGEMDPNRVVFAARLGGSPGSEPVEPSLLFFQPPRELELIVPAISLDYAAHDEGASLTLEADVLAKDVYLRLAGAKFSDNFFDLLPGQPKKVVLRTDKALDQIRSGLKVRTLAEVPKEGRPVGTQDGGAG